MALIDKETIRKEIERLKSLHSPIPFGDNYEVGYSDGYQDCCDNILAFLDSLSQQPVKGLKEAAREYAKEYTKNEGNGGDDWEDDIQITFEAGAEWGVEHLKR